MDLTVLKLWCITLAVSTSALEPIAQPDEAAAKLIHAHLSQIPDIEPTFIQNPNLGKIITRLFKGKLSALPLFNINLKIDRVPVRLPWNTNQTAINELVPEAELESPKHMRQYKYIPEAKQKKLAV